MPPTDSFLRKRVYWLDGPLDEVISGVVTRHIPFKRHPADRTKNEVERLRVKLDDGSFHTANLDKFTIEVPEKQIPQVWRDIIAGMNEECRHLVGVCYVPHTSPLATTLFHRENLQTLRVEVTSVEAGDVKLWPGQKMPTESKLDLNDGDTTYTVGDLVIEMEADSY